MQFKGDLRQWHDVAVWTDDDGTYIMGGPLKQTAPVTPNRAERRRRLREQRRAPKSANGNGHGEVKELVTV
jgi:hypothetical protein